MYASPQKPSTDHNHPKTLVKPKHSGQFDQNAVQFSYVQQNHGSKTKLDKQKEKERKQLEEQEKQLKEEFTREVKTKMAKKSKNAMIEVPMYLT